MYILALDTSGGVCSAAVLKDEKILSEMYVDNKKTHSESIAPMADLCLKEAGMGIKDINLFCCAAGPGSFTGIRIGVAMIKAFSQASGKPAVGVNTLDALAENLRGTDEIVCAVIDARRGEVYTASYIDGKSISEYRAVMLDEVLCELSGKKAVFVGDGAVNYRDKILSGSDGFRIAHPGIVLQRAGSVGLVAYSIYKTGNITDSYTLEPFYIKESQPERLSKSKG
jgi:tRNA threonylcarbamoyladenosine biosynthesis protein TsaB